MIHHLHLQTDAQLCMLDSPCARCARHIEHSWPLPFSAHAQVLSRHCRPRRTQPRQGRSVSHWILSRLQCIHAAFTLCPYPRPFRGMSEQCSPASSQFLHGLRSSHFIKVSDINELLQRHECLDKTHLLVLFSASFAPRFHNLRAPFDMHALF